MRKNETAAGRPVGERSIPTVGSSPPLDTTSTRRACTPCTDGAEVVGGRGEGRCNS